jgi:hypothetical protein
MDGPRTLWHRFSTDLAPFVARRADPFLPVTLVAARYLQR